jgi:hypothetical protein
MKFGGIIVLLLGLVIVAFVVKTQLAGTATGNPNDPTQAKRQLDNVRNRAGELEREQQKAADDIAKKTGGN